MSVPTLPGVEARTVTSDRITTRVLFAGPPDGIPILFLHGNLSNATWWEPNLVRLDPAYLGIAPDQRGYGGADPEKKIDATNGMGDLADDAAALLDALGIDRCHVVGNSMGGSILFRMIADHPGRIRSATLVDPGSPYGYGGTMGVDGTPTNEDFAGSGAGLVNPEMVRRLREGDLSTEDSLSPRNVFRSILVKPPLVVEREDAYVESMLETHFGDDAYPGDSEPSPNWPYVAPGRWGGPNGLSPRWSVDPQRILDADPKPPILWVRGTDSVIISDGGPLDPGTWGPSGLVPGFPGTDAYPPQPMVSQIRHFLGLWGDAGGTSREVAIEDTGHIPFIEKPDEFNEVLHAFVREIDKEEGKTQ